MMITHFLILQLLLFFSFIIYSLCYLISMILSFCSFSWFTFTLLFIIYINLNFFFIHIIVIFLIIHLISVAIIIHWCCMLLWVRHLLLFISHLLLSFGSLNIIKMQLTNMLWYCIWKYVSCSLEVYFMISSYKFRNVLSYIINFC